MRAILFRSLVILIIVAGGFFISGKISLAATADHLVISEVQITGGTGQTGNDFIELYNPTSVPIDLDGYRLVKRTAAGATDTSIKSWTSSTIIPAHGYYLWASISYTSISVTPDITTSQTIADNNGLALRFGPENTGTIMDAVGWGTATNIFIEGIVFSTNPGTNQSIERNFGGDLGNGEDTNDNSVDFNLQLTPNPQNISSPPKPDLPPPPGPVCGNLICESGEDYLICPADCAAPPPPPTEINPGDIVINEFVSDPAEGEEWIEIFNNKDSDIDLTGWKLEDGVGTIATLDVTITADGFQTIDLTSSKLNNSGDIIKLKNSDGTIIDQVAYGNWDDGDTSDNAPSTSDPNSVARKTDGGDTDNDLADFSATTTLTKNSANIITAPPSEETGGVSTPEEITPSSPPSWPVGSLLINEFIADPADGDVEWIEFYNPGDAQIDLAKWAVEDGGETATTLSGSIGPLGFFVLEKPKGILNNTGDAIILKDPAGIIIDKITYGNWDDGDTGDNAPTASDPNSVARKTDGENSTNDFNDFVVATPTKGASNAGGLQQNPNGAYSHDVIVNEIFPNPKGDDSQGEFIELKNIGTTDIDLTGWKVGDASSKRYTIKAADFTSIILKPNDFFVLYRSVTGIALNNSGTESTKIFSPDGALVSALEYSGSAAEDQSYAKDDAEYFWTSTPTPGKENLITRENQIPTAVISAPSEAEISEEINFDGSDSTDPDGDELIFSWNFGDGSEAAGANVNHVYSAAGKYKIILTVKDALGATATAEQFIVIANPDSAEENFSIDEQLIFINEVLPNPEGSDEAEWIEIKNIDLEPIDLSGWKLDDDEGGSRPYKIPDNTIINPGQFLIFKKSETKLAFNNTFDAARLLDPDGEIIFETSYDEVPEGASWARSDDGNFKWTTHLTPGEENIFEFQEKTATKKSSSTSTKKSQTFTETTLEDIRNLELNDGARVTGQVIVEPGILGSQIFYIATPAGCPGIQIYMYSKNFPELKLDDLVEITGILAESGGEKRIKISEQSDIKVLENQVPALRTPIKLSEVEEGLEGCLVSAAGEVTEKSGSNVYFADDDGELKIYFKSTLPFEKPKMNIGDQIETIGVVSQTKTGFRLLPRYENDLAIKTPSEISNSSISDSSAGNNKNNINLYLGAATGILGLTLVGLGIKSGSFSNWWKKIKGI
ncbi:lamin tail domain-containing protein [Patescibacteria group bacterium]|nr:lamin tail domain-containing protein [Patescibacteria group bacterium]